MYLSDNCPFACLTYCSEVDSDMGDNSYIDNYRVDDSIVDKIVYIVIKKYTCVLNVLVIVVYRHDQGC